MRDTEAYKFNGLVYRAVYNGIEPSGFATISVKCVRFGAIATRSERETQTERKCVTAMQENRDSKPKEEKRKEEPKKQQRKKLF